MRCCSNLIWLVFGGLVLAFGYAVAALVMLILIITIPFGIAAGRMALFCLWPFGARSSVAAMPVSRRRSAT